MAKIATLGNSATIGKDRFHELDNIDIKGNGPIKMKTWILLGLAVAAFLVYKNKSMA